MVQSLYLGWMEDSAGKNVSRFNSCQVIGAENPLAIGKQATGLAQSRPV
jgi:hypothetical protein